MHKNENPIKDKICLTKGKNKRKLFSWKVFKSDNQKLILYLCNLTFNV
jgi:hypothetical protein